MKKTALLIMVITLFSKFLGFARDIVLSYFFGASSTSDAYLISLTIPSVIFGFIGTGIVTAYIPMQSRIINELGVQSGYRFTSNFTNIILVIVSVIFSLGMIFTAPLVKIFAMGFSNNTLLVAINYTRITLFGMYFTALVSIFSGYLQINNNYIVPALIGFPLNIIAIISIFIASRSNPNVLAIGALLGIVAQFIILIPFIHREGFKYKLLIDINDDSIIRTLLIALPVIIGNSVNQVNILVDRTIASSLVIGGISALSYANRLNFFVQGLFVSSVITVIYPTMSAYASKRNFIGIKKVLSESINMITLFVLPMTVGSMLFNEEIIFFLFGRGAFDENAVLLASSALFFYSFGMLGFGLREVLSRGFYSIQDTKTPMINSSIGVILNIILNIVLSKYLGIGGLALATSISASFTTMLLFISFRKKIGSFGMKQISITFLKILFTSGLMGIFAKLCFNYLKSNLSQNLSLLIAISAGAVLYFVVIYLMKIEDVDIIVRAIKKKLYRESI